MAALEYVEVPGYSAAIFRRTKVESNRAEAPLERMRRWLAKAMAAGRCWWDDDANAFKFHTKEPGNPSTVHFGYAPNQTALESYQGASYQFIGIDELGAWSEAAYRYLFSRLRRTEELKGHKVPLRMRSTANPGGAGHAWIKARFVEHATHRDTGSKALADIKARRLGRPMPQPPVYVSPPSPEALELAKELGRTAQGAVFVPSFAQDNPGLDVASYRGQLLQLDPTRREQLEHGGWDATASGGFFSASSFEFVDVLPPVPRWVRSWDFAATAPKPGTDPDWTVGGKCGLWIPRDSEGRNGKPRFVIGNVARARHDPAELEGFVKGTASLDGKRVVQLMEQEPGSAGKIVIHNWATGPLFGWTVEGMRKTGPKDEYWRPLSGYAKHVPIIVLRAEWNAKLVDELLSLPIGHDDQADSVSTAYVWLTSGQDARSRAQALSS